MPVPLKIKGIGTLQYNSKKFALTTINIYGIDKKGRRVYVSISCKLHLDNRLKANILVGNNVFCMEEFAINLSTSSTLIYSCSVRIDVSARQYFEFLKQRILASGSTLMPS